MAQLTVVVTGSTGKQGGAVARGLLGRGHKVRAVTRDPNSSQAKLLANAGATLVAASLEDTAAIMKALEGATSLFAMTMPSGGAEARDTTRYCRRRRGQSSRRASRLHLSRLRQPADGHSALRQQVRGRKAHRKKSESAQQFSRPWPSWRTSISLESSSLKGSTPRRSRRRGRSRKLRPRTLARSPFASLRTLVASRAAL
jgi:NmrA-like family